MKLLKVLIRLQLLILLFFGQFQLVQAQVNTEATSGADATDSAGLNSDEASGSAEASSAAQIVRRITEKSSDLTEPQGEARGILEQYVMEKIQGPLTPFNFIQWSIRSAVMKGVPTNTIVLVLMFPLVAAIIAASRHLIGLRGFGIFTPAIVAVGFLATGLTAGFILFFTIILVATAARVLIRRLHLPYMPRTSLLLWVVSVTVLVILLLSPYLNLQDIANLSIFPILLMVLLAETFIEVQNKRSRAEAMEMTLETLLLAVFCYFIMNLEFVQKLIIINPEITLLGVAVFNIFLGKFGGLRLMEYWRFRKILD